MNDELTVEGMPVSIHKGLVRILGLRDEVIDHLSHPEAALEEIRKRSLPADVLTFLQRLPETTPKFSYPMQWDNRAVVEISTYENWFSSQIHKNTRNKIRKAERNGVTVEVEAFSDELAAGLVDLFNETPIRRGRPYVYHGWDLGRVKQGWATELDRSLWLVAYHERELIGFIKLVVGDGLARTSGTVAKEAHRDKAPMNALLAKAVEVCASKRIPLLTYGKFTYGREGEDSLTAFKRQNGFQSVNVPRYYVPVSRRGRIGLCLGLHRGLKDVVPGPALRLLLKVRSHWYEALGGGRMTRSGGRATA